MPYITQDRYDEARLNPKSPGELNYAITSLLTGYMDEQKISYTLLNAMLGALEGAKLEFYRRVVVPYENGKIAENGDVY